ncbi:imidazolonepropionase [Cytobacillus sp. Hz8]|uniref:imidazolonepropionase n=1 Tax=Cytobacillus sp. Hz8 TaxID=3347168 RepID=UPI0035DA44C6
MTKLLWIKHAAQLATLATKEVGPRRKKEMSELGLIENGSILVRNGIIQDVGRTDELEARHADHLEEATIVDATNHLITPGLVDSHTHVVFAGSREQEFEMRLSGATYMEIMESGGGIHATTRMTRAASVDELLEQTMKRLDSFLAHGVTTIEAKSGYGLDLETELKQLRVLKRLQQEHPIDLVPTFMGAHAIPAEFDSRAEEYVQFIIDVMLPIIAKERLAEFQDVFCEQGVFTKEQAMRILEAGKKWGLLPKIHADEIISYGGVEVAARVGAISAEHLLKTTKEGMKALARAGTIACLLPATALFLHEEAAKGREIIDAGVPVAISTDCNPGSSPTTSMPLVMNLACLLMRLTPREALTAATFNGACALNREKCIGSLEVGKQGDVVMWKVKDYRELQYQFGVNHVKSVWKKGVQVVNK